MDRYVNVCVQNIQNKQYEGGVCMLEAGLFGPSPEGNHWEWAPFMMLTFQQKSTNIVWSPAVTILFRVWSHKLKIKKSFHIYDFATAP
jgi:hypothetical protein